MMRGFRFLTSGIALGLVWIVGCAPAGPIERAGVSITVPSGWQRAPGLGVPGVSIVSWQGPKGATLSLYKTLAIPDGRAKPLVESLANRLENMPGLTVVERSVVKVAGIDAALVETIGPGTGGAWAPTGTGIPIGPPGVTLIPTRMVSLTFPRAADTLHLVCYCPEADFASVKPDWDAMTRSLTIRDAALSTSTY